MRRESSEHEGGLVGGERPSLTDFLTKEILGLIAAQRLQVGDSLPPTGVLARTFGVAAPTIREALRRLEATGTVVFRHGFGVTVGPNVERLVLANPHAVASTRPRLEALLDARSYIEPVIAGLAASRRTPEDIADLCAILDTAERELANDQLLGIINLDFHRRVATASANSVLSEIVDSVLTLHGTDQRLILDLYQDRQRDLEEHRQILEALTIGDASLSAERCRQHLEDVKRVICARLADGGP